MASFGLLLPRAVTQPVVMVAVDILKQCGNRIDVVYDRVHLSVIEQIA